MSRYLRRALTAFENENRRPAEGLVPLEALEGCRAHVDDVAVGRFDPRKRRSLAPDAPVVQALETLWRQALHRCYGRALDAPLPTARAAAHHRVGVLRQRIHHDDFDLLWVHYEDFWHCTRELDGTRGPVNPWKINQSMIGALRDLSNAARQLDDHTLADQAGELSERLRELTH